MHGGLEEYGEGFRDWFPAAHQQIEHCHVAERLWEVSGVDRTRFEEPKPPAFADPVALARTLRRSRRIWSEPAHEAAGYLEAVPRASTVWMASTGDGRARWVRARS